MAIIYVDGQPVVKGPYSRDYRGKKVGRSLVRQVPRGYLDFFVLDANGNKVKRRLEKEEFQSKAVFKPNPNGTCKE
jgi:hypothetical protein